ncbi:MAG: hypothetical protein IKZ58_01505 [Selenomonadaceae bacterium]|nr:hypothetical protein [Selenomonadaceae bacterium]
MKKFFILTSFICAIIFTATANAANWSSLGTDNFGNEYFLDTESVSLYKHEGNRTMFYVSFKTVFSDSGRKKLEQENLASVVSLYAFANNNGQKLSAELSIRATALDGSLIDEMQANSPKWAKINPNSVIEAIYEEAYKYLRL